MMMHNFGHRRVLEPKGFIPITAWKLDNRAELGNGEIRIALSRIKFEEGSFRQLCNEYSFDEKKIKLRILDIIKKRGKLHNPSTDTGGICAGVIDEIGPNYTGSGNLKKGDRVISITTLTGLPMYVDRIGRIDMNYAQADAEGYVIAFNTSPLIHLPEGLDLSYTLSAMDESASVSKAFRLAGNKKSVMLLGSSMLSVMLYAAAVRKATGEGCRVVAVIDRESTATLSRDEIQGPLAPFIDELYLADILSPIDTFKWLEKKEPHKFDMSINCADLIGAEAISVMLTKDKGILFFTSIINNYNLAILFAETLGKDLETISLDEFDSGFYLFTVSLMREIKGQLEMLDRVYNSHTVIGRTPNRVNELVKYQEAGRIDDFIFASDKTKDILDQVLNIAGYDCNVVIQGETGVGKEKILGLIYKNSSRKLNPCIKINCATIQENLAESEFFGYEPGSFTGASEKGKPGYFELANNGILFLDEVGELSLSLQSKLLRVLQDNQFYRIGGREQISVNVRVISASNVSLRELVRKGRFREDLYYRLNICEIDMPPLRERREDIICLARNFVDIYNDRYMSSKMLGEDALRELEEYSWPGNVRELDNTVHRAMINTRENRIDGEAIRQAISSNLYGRNRKAGPDSGPYSLNEKEDLLDIIYSEDAGLRSDINEREKNLIASALREKGTTRKAAEALGISQSQLMRKKKKYRL